MIHLVYQIFPFSLTLVQDMPCTDSTIDIYFRTNAPDAQTTV